MAARCKTTRLALLASLAAREPASPVLTDWQGPWAKCTNYTTHGALPAAPLLQGVDGAMQLSMFGGNHKNRQRGICPGKQIMLYGEAL